MAWQSLIVSVRLPGGNFREGRMGFLDWLLGRTGGVDSSNSSKGKIMFRNISGEEAARKISGENIVVLDVRTPREYEQSHIPSAVLIPLQQLPERCGELDPQKEAHRVRVWVISYLLEHASKDFQSEIIFVA